MREKQPRLVATFYTATAAMEMERYCLTNNIPGRLIPTPREISAECGLVWSAPPEAEPLVRQAAVTGKIEIAAAYQLML